MIPEFLYGPDGLPTMLSTGQGRLVEVEMAPIGLAVVKLERLQECDCPTAMSSEVIAELHLPQSR